MEPKKPLKKLFSKPFTNLYRKLKGKSTKENCEDNQENNNYSQLKEKCHNESQKHCESRKEYDREIKPKRSDSQFSNDRSMPILKNNNGANAKKNTNRNPKQKHEEEPIEGDISKLEEKIREEQDKPLIKTNEYDWDIIPERSESQLSNNRGLKKGKSTKGTNEGIRNKTKDNTKEKREEKHYEHVLPPLISNKTKKKCDDIKKLSDENKYDWDSKPEINESVTSNDSGFNDKSEDSCDEEDPFDDEQTSAKKDSNTIEEKLNNLKISEGKSPSVKNDRKEFKESLSKGDKIEEKLKNLNIGDGEKVKKIKTAYISRAPIRKTRQYTPSAQPYEVEIHKETHLNSLSGGNVIRNPKTDITLAQEADYVHANLQSDVDYLFQNVSDNISDPDSLAILTGSSSYINDSQVVIDENEVFKALKEYEFTPEVNQQLDDVMYVIQNDDTASNNLSNIDKTQDGTYDKIHQDLSHLNVPINNEIQNFTSDTELYENGNHITVMDNPGGLTHEISTVQTDKQINESYSEVNISETYTHNAQFENSEYNDSWSPIDTCKFSQNDIISFVNDFTQVGDCSPSDIAARHQMYTYPTPPSSMTSSPMGEHNLMPSSNHLYHEIPSSTDCNQMQSSNDNYNETHYSSDNDQMPKADETSNSIGCNQMPNTNDYYHEMPKSNEYNHMPSSNEFYNEISTSNDQMPKSYEMPSPTENEMPRSNEITYSIDQEFLNNNDNIGSENVKEKEKKAMGMKQFKHLQKSLAAKFIKMDCCDPNRPSCDELFQGHIQKLAVKERISLCLVVAKLNVSEAKECLHSTLDRLSDSSNLKDVNLSQSSVNEDWLYALFFLICEKFMSDEGGKNRWLFVGESGLELLKRAALRCPRRPLLTRQLARCARTVLRAQRLPGPVYQEVDANGDNLVTACVRRGDEAVPILYELVDKENTLFDIEHTNFNELSALHIACKQHSPLLPSLNVVHVLLKHGGANLLKEHTRDSPLHLAVSSPTCDLDLIMVMFEHVDQKEHWRHLARLINTSKKSPYDYAKEAKKTRKNYPSDVLNFFERCSRMTVSKPETKQTPA